MSGYIKSLLDPDRIETVVIEIVDEKETVWNDTHTTTLVCYPLAVLPGLKMMVPG